MAHRVLMLNDRDFSVRLCKGDACFEASKYRQGRAERARDLGDAVGPLAGCVNQISSPAKGN